HDRVSLQVAAEVGQHFPLVGQEARVTPLAGLQGKKVITDDALEPFHTILAGHAKFATMREVGDPDGSADSPILADHIAIMSRHLPVEDLLERSLQCRMLVM